MDVGWTVSVILSVFWCRLSEWVGRLRKREWLGGRVFWCWVVMKEGDCFDGKVIYRLPA